MQIQLLQSPKLYSKAKRKQIWHHYSPSTIRIYSAFSYKDRTKKVTVRSCGTARCSPDPDTALSLQGSGLSGLVQVTGLPVPQAWSWNKIPSDGKANQVRAFIPSHAQPGEIQPSQHLLCVSICSTGVGQELQGRGTPARVPPTPCPPATSSSLICTSQSISPAGHTADLWPLLCPPIH